MSIYKRGHAIDHSVSGNKVEIVQKRTAKKRSNEAFHDFVHLPLTYFLKRLFLQAQSGVVSLVLHLVKLVHGPETGAQEEKVKLLVGFFILVICASNIFIMWDHIVRSFLTDILFWGRNYLG